MKKPVLESLFNRVADLKACHFIKKRLPHRCFHVNIAKFLRTGFLTEKPLVATSRLKLIQQISIILLNCHIKDQTILEIYQVSKLSNLMAKKTMWAKLKNQTVKLLNLLFLWKPTRMHKISIIAQFSLDIMHIYYRELLLAFPGVSPYPYEWTESNSCTYEEATCKK